jgi:hypothetical protein
MCRLGGRIARKCKSQSIHRERHLYALRSMLWKEEGPLEAQLPISAAVIGRQNIAVSG